MFQRLNLGDTKFDFNTKAFLSHNWGLKLPKTHFEDQKPFKQKKKSERVKVANEAFDLFLVAIVSGLLEDRRLLSSHATQRWASQCPS